MTILYLDSNIYRQLGLKFKDHIDYKNLTNLLESSANEFGLLEVVFAELTDYYKHDIFGPIISDHAKLHKRYQTNIYLPDIAIPETTIPLKKAMEDVSADLKDFKYFTKLHYIEPNFLLDFLLYNKRLNKKDNTRDFLIFNSLISLCKEHPKDYLVLISQDKIFTTNDFFKNVIKREKITNLKFYESISFFLKDFGPKLEFITHELILNKIAGAKIEKELMKDIKCFPSYVSQYYYEKKDNEVPDIESLEVGKIRVHDFYVVKDYKTSNLSIIVSLEVKVKAIYKPEANKEQLDEYLSSLEKRPFPRHKNIFDKEGRPVFEGGVLFIYKGVVDEVNSTIKTLHFVDFMPDYFIIEEIKKQINQQPSLLKEDLVCQHEFDTDNGYLKNSRYGGGLSLHYRCKKCRAEFDTGEDCD
jgi:hypothetical protein